VRQFSIVTPTFNRAKYLPRIYECLRQQNNIDFEWIIVDDGSSDNTKEIVESLIDRDVYIKYIYQENAGQLSARNTGTKNADSYILTKLDDDDLLCQGALEKVWNYFSIKTGKFQDNCVCLSGLCQYETGEIVGKKFPDDYFVSDHIRYRQNKHIHGDKSEFYVTSIFKKYPFPVIQDEKNMPPHIVHERIARDYTTLYVNHVFAIKNFMEGGLSTQKYVYKYTKGSELYHNEASMPPFNLKLKIHHSSRYIFFAKKNKRKQIFKSAKNKKIFILGLCRYHMILLKMFLEKFHPFSVLIKITANNNTKFVKKITSDDYTQKD